MRELPILFTGEMVRAILAGRKTQTRRVVKVPEGVHIYRASKDSVTAPRPGIDPVCAIPEDMIGDMEPNCPDMMPRCPYGQPGDLLYVRETVRCVGSYYNPHRGEFVEAVFSADDTPAPIDTWPWLTNPLRSIHMPKGAARLWLHIEDVRVERVQEITEGDAKAEGVPSVGDGYGCRCCNNPPDGDWHQARYAFGHLWDRINAKRGLGWDTNPWVWVVSFEVASTTGRSAVRKVAA